MKKSGVLNDLMRFVTGVFFLVVFSGHGMAQSKKVLILHSYHQGLSWTDQVNEGIHSVFQDSPELELYYEYLDSKRRYDKPYQDVLEELFVLKHQNSEFDLVMLVDNNALDFASLEYEQFFKDVPLVFCGINDYSDSLMTGLSNYTGVIEDPDIKASILLAQRYHPEMDNLVVINDNITTSSKINRQLVIDIWEELEPSYDLHFLENLTLDQLADSVRGLPQNNAILLLNYSRDADGVFVSYHEAIELVRRNTDLPMYGVWDFYLDRGIIGGKLTSGFKQGELAAILVLRVLSGTDPDDIPIVRTDHNYYAFDYEEMTRHGITMEFLPPGSEVINLPVTFLSKYSWLIILLLSFGFVIMLVVLYQRFKRLRNEKRLIETNLHLKETRNRLMKALDAGSDGSWEYRFSENKMLVSENLWERLGYKKENIEESASYFKELVHPDDVELFVEERKKIYFGESEHFVVELRVMSVNEEWHWFRIKAKVFEWEDNGRPHTMVGTLNDITQRKNAEARNKEDEIKLKASERRWRSLMEQAVDEVVLHDFDGRILDVNIAACDILGYGRDELVDSDVSNLYEMEKIPYLKMFQKELSAASPALKFESVRKRKDGSSFPVEVHLSLIDLVDTRFVLSISSDISVRNETERKVLNAVIKAEEKERKRFASDLHDSIGPLLSSINLYLSGLSGLNKEEKSQKIIKASKAIVDEAIVSIKEISNNLSPHVLNDFGLKKAIESFVEKLNVSGSINLVFRSENLDDRMNPQVEVVVYRIVTELINNTMKHADARSIELTIRRRENKLTVIFLDDGIGFNVEKVVSESTGMGLYNILSRVKSIHGTYDITSNPDIGGMMAVIKVKL